MKILYSLIAASIFILIAAACGSDGDSSDEGSRDVAASFSFEAFGNGELRTRARTSASPFEATPISSNCLVLPPRSPGPALKCPTSRPPSHPQGRGRLSSDPAAWLDSEDKAGVLSASRPHLRRRPDTSARHQRNTTSRPPEPTVFPMRPHNRPQVGRPRSMRKSSTAQSRRSSPRPIAARQA